MNTTSQQQINNDDIILDRINAMRLQEEDDTSSTIQIKNYLTAEVNEACRKAMIDWCFTVVDAFDLSRESVAISMSLLDRYLSSNNGKCFCHTIFVLIGDFFFHKMSLGHQFQFGSK